MGVTDEGRAQSTVSETSADHSRDYWYASAKVRDSKGAQWAYFPAIIRGSNVPDGGLITLDQQPLTTIHLKFHLQHVCLTNDFCHEMISDRHYQPHTALPVLTVRDTWITH